MLPSKGPASEFGNGYGSGDSGVQRLGAGIVDWVWRNEKSVRNQLFHTGGNTVGFIADDYHTRSFHIWIQCL